MDELKKIVVRPLSAKLFRDTEWIGEMDPFCLVSIGEKKIKTTVHSNGGRFPAWYDELVFLERLEGKVIIKCYNQNLFLPDAFIGSAEIWLKRLLERQCLKKWVNLYYRDRVSGELYVEIRYVPETENPRESKYQFSI